MLPLFFVIASAPLIVDRLSIDRDMLSALPTSSSTNNALEMLMMPATFSNIETGGFSKPDAIKLSLFGDSNTQTRYSIDGLDVSDPLHAGAEAIRMPFALIGQMRLRFSESTDALTSGIEYEIAEELPHVLVTLRGAFPDMGGITPGAVELFQKVANHRHPLQLYPLPPTERRRFVENGSASLVLRENQWVLGTDVDIGQRRFLRHAPEGSNGTYDESFVLASVVARYKHTAFNLTFALDYRFRENANAELFYGEAETFARHSIAAMAGLSTEHLKANVLVKVENDDARGAGFTRELRDLDGMALHPFTARGTRVGVSLDATYERSIRHITRAFAHIGQRGVGYAPNIRNFSNTLMLDGVTLGRYDFQSRPSFYAYGELQAGLRDVRDFGSFRLGYSLYAMVSHMTHAGRAETVGAIDFGFKAYAQWRGTQYFMPFISASRTPIAFQQNVAEMLGPNILSGSAFAGDTLYDTTGGASIQQPGALAMPKTHALSFGWQSQLSEHWSLNVFALGKTFDDSLWLRFASGDPTVQLGDRAYLTPGEKRYTLVNYPFPQIPFYAGAHLQLVGTDKNRYFVSVGGSAYFSWGTTAFGIGPLSNDMGIVDQSMANPNTRRFPIGNLEGDRAYYGKIAAGVRVIDTLWASLAFRYKDGRPFTYIMWSAENGQAQPIYQSPKGSLLALDGPRESARINLDLKITYTLVLAPRVATRVSLLIWNAFDLGQSILERQIVDGQLLRSSAEVDIPRGGMLTVELAIP
jgi:hypothetical protein